MRRLSERADKRGATTLIRVSVHDCEQAERRIQEHFALRQAAELAERARADEAVRSERERAERMVSAKWWKWCQE